VEPVFSVEQYAMLAHRKLEVARVHLSMLEQELAVGLGDPYREADLWAICAGHADGAVLQAYGAFDTFACGLAILFGLHDPEKAQFNSLTKRLSEPSAAFVSDRVTEVCEAVRLVHESKAFHDLTWYRNLAAHRGLLAQRTKYGEELSLHLGDLTHAPDMDRSDVVPVVARLVEGAEENLQPLLLLLPSDV
jgi:hypothetical protein